MNKIGEGRGEEAAWTLTPPAINAWVGEELRILGSEATLEWRGAQDYFQLTAAAFAGNETAGAAIDAYGWTFNNRATGLFDHVRLPNALSEYGGSVNSNEFRQFDHSVRWYAGVTWERPELGRLALLRYDNEADPNAHDATEAAWHTKFWSLGFSTEIGPVQVLAQALAGSTATGPDGLGGSDDTTDFWAYYVLAGIERGDWRFAVRYDQFGTTNLTGEDPPHNNQHGVALTTAATWTVHKGVALIGELLAADYSQKQRALVGKPAQVTEVQAQLALRLTF